MAEKHGNEPVTTSGYRTAPHIEAKGCTAQTIARTLPRGIAPQRLRRVTYFVEPLPRKVVESYQGRYG